MSHRTDLRKEYNYLRNSGELIRHCGTSCVNCGSTENVEYHHIVPLLLGGTNNFANIVPLCHRCHKAAHGSHHMSHYVDHSNSGRKPKVPDEEAFAVYDRWVDGQFGNRKCQQLLKLTSSTKPNSTEQYKRYITARGIKSVRHNYDYVLTVAAQSANSERVVGKVTYLDGREEPIMFKDFGENDDIEYEFCARNNRSLKTTMTWGEFKNGGPVSTEDTGLAFEEPVCTEGAGFASGGLITNYTALVHEDLTADNTVCEAEDLATEFIRKLKQEDPVPIDTSKMRGRNNPLYGTVVTVSIPAERMSGEEKRSRDAWWKEYRKKLRAEAAGM